MPKKALTHHLKVGFIPRVDTIRRTAKVVAAPKAKLNRFSQMLIPGNPSTSCNRAFTLIELLIVVAILAILAAIAVPNLLEAQTRSKVSRVKNDLRVLDGALAAYQVDWNVAPVTINFFDPVPSERFAPLINPVEYISSVPRDPFRRKEAGVYERTILGINPDEPMDMYIYNTAASDFGLGHAAGAREKSQYSLASGGPDLVLEFPYYGFSPSFVTTRVYLSYLYDPTNGTISRGEIFRRGGYQPDQIPGLQN